MADSSRNLDVHQRNVLLAAVAVAVAQAALHVWTRDGGLDRVGVVAEEELHLLRGEPVEARHDLARQGAGILDPQVARFVLEHDVERQLERPGVLAADEAGEAGESRHAATNFSSLPFTSESSIGNI